MQKLLYTGGTGFLGANTKPILDHMYEVTTVGITDRDEIKANFAKEVPVLPCRYDVVLHAAGKAHINPKTQDEIQSFYNINYQGTVNLCKALEKAGAPKSFIFISTCGMEPGNMKPYLADVLKFIHTNGKATVSFVAHELKISKDEAEDALDELVD